MCLGITWRRAAPQCDVTSFTFATREARGLHDGAEPRPLPLDRAAAAAPAEAGQTKAAGHVVTCGLPLIRVVSPINRVVHSLMISALAAWGLHVDAYASARVVHTRAERVNYAFCARVAAGFLSRVSGVCV